MIGNRNALQNYLNEDLKARGKKPTMVDAILHNEKWYIYRYLRHLRYVEYYKNTSSNKLLFLWHWFWYKRLGFKLHTTIYPNTIGPGCIIYHTGEFIFIKKSCSIGCNSILRPGVVIGKKNVNEHDDENPVHIGDNCEFGIGVKIFGKVNIGNNVTIGAYSIVTKDIPDNAIVAGIPAKIIRFK